MRLSSCVHILSPSWVPRSPCFSRCPLKKSVPTQNNYPFCLWLKGHGLLSLTPGWGNAPPLAYKKTNCMWILVMAIEGNSLCKKGTGIPSVRHAAIPRISGDAFTSVSTFIRADVLTSSVLQKVLQSTLLPSNQANQVQVMHLPLLNLVETQGEQEEVEDTFVFLGSAKK